VFEVSLYVAMVVLFGIAILVVLSSFQLLTLPAFVYDFWLVGVFSNVSLAAVKIVVGFFTVLTSMVAVADAKFPAPFKEFVDLLQQDGVDGFTAKCNMFDAMGISGDDAFTSVQWRAYAWFFSPLVLAVAIVALGYVRCCYVGRSQPSAQAFVNLDEIYLSRRREILGQHASAVSLLAYIFVPMTAHRLFLALDCISVGSDKLLRSDTLVSCESEKYVEFKQQLFFFIVATLLVPLIFLFQLIIVRAKVNPTLTDGDDGSLLVYVRARDETIQGLRTLFQDYKPRFYYFDIIDIYRRVVFVGALQFFKTDTREAAGVLFGFLAVLATSEIKPYARTWANVLSTVSQVMIVLMYAGTYALENGTLERVNSLIVAWIFVLLSTSVVAFTVFLAFRAYKVGVHAALVKLERTQRKIEFACGFSGERNIFLFLELCSTNALIFSPFWFP
jgi:hypothetical protein